MSVHMHKANHDIQSFSVIVIVFVFVIIVVAGFIFQDLKLGSQVDNDSWTIAHYAASLGNVRLIEIARSCGVLEKKDKRGRLPIHIAAMKGNLNVIHRLALDLDRQVC